MGFRIVFREPRDLSLMLSTTSQGEFHRNRPLLYRQSPIRGLLTIPRREECSYRL